MLSVVSVNLSRGLTHITPFIDADTIHLLTFSFFFFFFHSRFLDSSLSRFLVLSILAFSPSFHFFFPFFYFPSSIFDFFPLCLSVYLSSSLTQRYKHVIKSVRGTPPPCAKRKEKKFVFVQLNITINVTFYICK